MRFAGLVLDLDAFTLARESGEAIALTRGEFALLCFFVSHPGRVLSRDALLEAMAGRRFEPFDRSVDVLVGRLRRKIEADPKKPRLIVTVPGEGYRFDGLTKTFQSAPTGRARTANPASLEPPNPNAMDLPPDPPDVLSHAPERRHIIALAAELVPSRGGRLPDDPEDLGAIIGAFRGYASAAITRHGGEIGGTRGREIVAYFGHLVAQENDAERAVRAALAIQLAASELNASNAVKPRFTSPRASELSWGRWWSTQTGRSSGKHRLSPRGCRRPLSPTRCWSRGTYSAKLLAYS